MPGVIFDAIRISVNTLQGHWLRDELPPERCHVLFAGFEPLDNLHARHTQLMAC